MKVDLDTLMQNRALVRLALGKSRLEDFLLHVFKKGNLYVAVYSCDKEFCYECGEKFNENGLVFGIIGEAISKLTGEKYKFSEKFCFHSYHFQ